METILQRYVFHSNANPNALKMFSMDVKHLDGV